MDKIKFASITLSTLITDAPKSAKTIPQKGPGASPASSKTLMPFRDSLIMISIDELMKLQLFRESIDLFIKNIFIVETLFLTKFDCIQFNYISNRIKFIYRLILSDYIFHNLSINIC